MGTSALNFLIAGHEDHPIYEADLSVRESAPREDRSQYLHQVKDRIHFKGICMAFNDQEQGYPEVLGNQCWEF